MPSYAFNDNRIGPIEKIDTILDGKDDIAFLALVMVSVAIQQARWKILRGHSINRKAAMA